MKPNFALDLTFDGIALLHRAGEAGWHVVGEVPVDSPSLGDDLAALRKKANTLDPSGMRTKLVIPDEQIRYLDIPVATAPDGDYDAAAADALDGATPYALDELAFDWTAHGARLHIAAVARETLEEAESFAREHEFNPVCFVADPDQALFVGEPFFGMTEEAESADPVERETGPMTRLGTFPEAETEEGGTTGADKWADEKAPLAFASVRAERGLPPKSEPRLEGVARITPSPLPDAQARAISGAAHASLAPLDDAAPPGPAPDKSKTPRPSRKSPATPEISPEANEETSTRITATREPGAATLTPTDEAERLTIFGARSKSDPRRGKPRLLGLFLTAGLLILLVCMAAWAAVFPDSGLGRLLRGAEPQIAVTPDIPELEAPDPQSSAAPSEAASSAPAIAAPDTREAEPEIDTPDLAALPTPETKDDSPETAATREPQEPVAKPGASGTSDQPETGDDAGGWTAPYTPEELQRRYAATGIWPLAPGAPDEPRSGSLETFYQTSIDEQVNLRDAVALPRARALSPDLVPPRTALPPPPGRTFELDARGFVRATPEGALTPEGIRVHSGPPPIRPPETPPRAVPLPGLTPTEEAVEARETLSDIRPRSRPETLIEEHERGAFGGRTRTELATLRPRVRPAEITVRAEAEVAARAEAEAVAAEVAEATDEAVAESLKPRLRPKEIARAAVPRPAAASAPAIPTSASIARRATERNAINLRQVNLIGVYGTPSDRRALVRLSNGRYRKVQVGDRIDGGRVSAIGDTELRYTKSGRSVVLRMPRG